jgi:hypothetical protein
MILKNCDSQIIVQANKANNSPLLPMKTGEHFPLSGEKPAKGSSMRAQKPWALPAIGLKGGSGPGGSRRQATVDEHWLVVTAYDGQVMCHLGVTVEVFYRCG